MFKYLRITVTALSLTACVLLIALWVRSYWYADTLRLFHALSVTLQSFAGRQHIAFYSEPWKNYKPSKTQPDPRRIWDWKLTSRPLPNRDYPSRKFRWLGDDDGFEVFVPHWFSILLFGAIAAAPWIKLSRRFSLRALFIATTLVAVVLGVLVAVN